MGLGTEACQVAGTGVDLDPPHASASLPRAAVGNGLGCDSTASCKPCPHLQQEGLGSIGVGLLPETLCGTAGAAVLTGPCERGWWGWGVPPRK